MTAIDPKALEAALEAAESKKGLVSRFGQQEAYHQYGEKAIQTYIEHPAADLVPRTDLEGCLERGRQVFKGRALKAENERDEARVKLWKALDERDEARAQIAALWGAAKAALDETEFHKLPCGKYQVLLKGAFTLGHVKLRNVMLTDTDKAAAQYQRVPHGWHVVQIPVDEDVPVDASNPDNPEAGEEG